MTHKIQFTINGETVALEVEPRQKLVDVIREEIGLTGTKKGCGDGDCGACSILLDGKLVNSCLVLAVEADGKEITTIEGLADGDKLHPLQQSFIDHGAIQCGYCTPGMILSAKVLLDQDQNPSEESIRKAIGGNLCRCTGYTKIIEAIAAVPKNG